MSVMTNHEKIIETVNAFVSGGDNRDVIMLEKILHMDFRVASNNFMGTPGITVITRNEYLAHIKEGRFGGLPRIIKIESIDMDETIASVKLRLESDENNFVSYNSLVLDTDDTWKIIHNLAVVIIKK